MSQRHKTRHVVCSHALRFNLVLVALVSMVCAAAAQPPPPPPPPPPTHLPPQSRASPTLYANVSTSGKLQLRVVDFGDPEGTHADVVRAAGQEHGAFLVINHGVSAAVLDDARDALAAFFALPHDAKMTLANLPPTESLPEGQLRNLCNGYAHLGKERIDALNGGDDAKPDPTEKFSMTFGPGFVLDPAVSGNVFHPDVPAMQTRMEALLVASTALGRRVFREVAVAAGVAPDHFDRFLTDGRTCALRSLMYPGGAGDTQQLRMAPHTDRGPLTLLPSDPSESLEYLMGKTWLPVAYHPDAFLVHLGDFLTVLTGDYGADTRDDKGKGNGNGGGNGGGGDQSWKSNWHRVGRPRPSSNGTYPSRLSLAHFFNFDPSTPVRPLRQLHDDVSNDAGAVELYADWLIAQFAKTYNSDEDADDGTSGDDNGNAAGTLKGQKTDEL